MHKRKSHSLSLVLAALVLACLLLVLVLGGAFLWRQWELQRENAVDRLRDRARSLQLAVDRELSLHHSVLATLATSETIDRKDWRRFHAAAREAAGIRPGTWIVLLDENGKMLVNTAVPFGTPLPDMKSLQQAEPLVPWKDRMLPSFDARVLHAPVMEGRPAYSDLFYGPMVRGPVLAVAVPVIRDGRVLYSLDNGYTPEAFVALLEQQRIAPGSWASIVDGTGTIIARSLNTEQTLGRKALPPFNEGGSVLPREGVGEARTLEGERAMYAFSRSAVSDWTVITITPVATIFAPARRALINGVAAFLVLGALLAYLAYALWRGLALPLSALALYAANRHADKRPPLPDTRIREVQTLAQALREADETERARRDEVRRRLDIEERERSATLRLTEALREADRRKDEFLAMLAHELRNPLAPISNAVALMRRIDPADAAMPALRDMIERQTRHLVRLVDDLLDVSRITRGKVELRRAELDLVALLKHAADTARPQLEARRQTLVSGMPDEPIVIQADELRLTQVMGNLLNNASKYTEAGGRIELYAHVEAGEAVIRVADNGTGIDAVLLPHVFDLFRQGDRTPAREQGGLGIGLTLVKRLTEMHGGRVEARSAGRGQGATFELRLPLRAPGEEPRAAQQGQRRATDAARPLQVLVVDDNSDAADSLAALLRSTGHSVRVAYSGHEAIELARQESADAVLMDIGMPGLDGYETARRLLAMPDARPRAIIAVTGYGGFDDQRAANDAGFDEHLVKPVDLERLELVLRRVVERA